MREKSKQMIKVVTATDASEFERKFNEASEDLAQYEPEIKIKDGDGFCAYFMYIVNICTPESVEDQFDIHDCVCKCCECPFIEIGTDARRKWFPCPYSSTGETRLDSPACDVFYKEAIKRMREEAGR